MNTDIHAVRRRVAACAVATVVLPAFAACGADLDPPAQNINRDKADKNTSVTVPKHTSGNRLDFGDEYGKRTAKQRTGPDERQSLNRMNFGDNGL